MKKDKVKLHNKYGKLTVIEKIITKKYDQNLTSYKCQCDCGNIKIIVGSQLLNKNTKSCGCLIKEKHYKLEIGEAAFNHLYKNNKDNAKKRNIDWNIDKEQFRKFTKNLCFYCGEAPNRQFYMKYKNGNMRLNGAYYYNGLDRIDSNKEYSKDNILTCCKICNYMKQNLTIDEFYLHLYKIINYKERPKDSRNSAD